MYFSTYVILLSKNVSLTLPPFFHFSTSSKSRQYLLTNKANAFELKSWRHFCSSSPVLHWCQVLPILVLQWCPATYLIKIRLLSMTLKSLKWLPYCFSLTVNDSFTILTHSATVPSHIVCSLDSVPLFHVSKNPILVLHPVGLLLSIHSKVLSLSSKPQPIIFSCSTSQIHLCFIKYLCICLFFPSRF